jgi:hypothetical protein
VQERDATEGIPGEPSLPGEPEATREASGVHAVSPPPCSVRLAIACSMIALKNCRSGPNSGKCSSFGFHFEAGLEASVGLLLISVATGKLLAGSKGMLSDAHAPPVQEEAPAE